MMMWSVLEVDDVVPLIGGGSRTTTISSTSTTTVRGVREFLAWGAVAVTALAIPLLLLVKSRSIQDKMAT